MQQFERIVDFMIQNYFFLAVPPFSFSTQEDRRCENMNES